MACPEGELRIGLAWKGNPRFENDVDRSLPSLAVLAPLADIPGVRFFSLQKGVGQEEAQQAQNPLSVVDLGSRIGDFADTAAIMMNLDLVITVDTAVAHLAGALARPCWVLLPDYQTDWRWLADRVDSPWYPGVMRLFRQRLPGDWTTTIADVKAGLMARLAVGGASPARP
jgi:ADP-heptose:LPS heptosyltransferase